MRVVGYGLNSVEDSHGHSAFMRSSVWVLVRFKTNGKAASFSLAGNNEGYWES